MGSRSLGGSGARECFKGSAGLRKTFSSVASSPFTPQKFCLVSLKDGCLAPKVTLSFFSPGALSGYEHADSRAGDGPV